MATFTLDKKQNSQKTGMGVLQGVAQGAVAGAGIGAAGGPVGAAIGAAIGGVAGGIRGGATAGLTDKAQQKDTFAAEQKAATQKKNAAIDAEAQDRAGASLPRAAQYATPKQSAFATPTVGQTSYDAWKGGY